MSLLDDLQSKGGVLRNRDREITGYIRLDRIAGFLHHLAVEQYIRVPNRYGGEFIEHAAGETYGGDIGEPEVLHYVIVLRERYGSYRRRRIIEYELARLRGRRDGIGGGDAIEQAVKEECAALIGQ